MPMLLAALLSMLCLLSGLLAMKKSAQGPHSGWLSLLYLASWRQACTSTTSPRHSGGTCQGGEAPPQSLTSSATMSGELRAQGPRFHAQPALADLYAKLVLHQAERVCAREAIGAKFVGH
eukprot:3647486-Amphidinium_carterae.2